MPGKTRGLTTREPPIERLFPEFSKVFSVFNPDAGSGGNFSFENHMDEPLPLEADSQVDGQGPIDWSDELARHGRWLRSVVRSRLGDWGLVDDVLQEVSAAAMRSAGRPTERKAVAPWLYRVALRRCLMQRRTLGRRRKLLANVAEQRRAEEDSSNDPLEGLMGRERNSAVHDALRRLNPTDRDVFVLKHTENWTYQQLAERLGCSVNTIEHRLLRTRQRLRKELAALGVTGASS